MASSTHVSSSSSYGSLKKVRLWSEERLVDWHLDLSRMLSSTQIKDLIASQFNRSGGTAFFAMMFIIFDI
jgi:hypothetical protein